MKYESAWNRLALLCFAINHVQDRAERAVGAAKHLAWHRGENSPRGVGAKEHGIKNEEKSVLTWSCYLSTHISQHMMGNYQRFSTRAGKHLLFVARFQHSAPLSLIQTSAWTQFYSTEISMSSDKRWFTFIWDKTNTHLRHLSAIIHFIVLCLIICLAVVL